MVGLKDGLGCLVGFVSWSGKAGLFGRKVLSIFLACEMGKIGFMGEEEEVSSV